VDRATDKASGFADLLSDFDRIACFYQRRGRRARMLRHRDNDNLRGWENFERYVFAEFFMLGGVNPAVVSLEPLLAYSFHMVIYKFEVDF
jgi:hypothetical protein